MSGALSAITSELGSPRTRDAFAGIQKLALDAVELVKVIQKPFSELVHFVRDRQSKIPLQVTNQIILILLEGNISNYKRRANFEGSRKHPPRHAVAVASYVIWNEKC